MIKITTVAQHCIVLKYCIGSILSKCDLSLGSTRLKTKLLLAMPHIFKYRFISYLIECRPNRALF